ncbi:MAG: RsmE family RNA methyltransferase [Spirochaetia bacterium]|jgi:RsmE family RNA methyltransferase|nr:RsmE family RNA methyltransferase [Spirochaetia bacterium]
MNIILFSQEEIDNPVSAEDIRAHHVINILKLSPGESFDAAVINKGSGKALIKNITSKEITFTFKFSNSNVKRNPVSLLTAVTRPPEAKKILKNCTSIGISTLFLSVLDKSEKSYIDSTLWKNANYKKYLIEGASQAFAADIPEVKLFQSLSESLSNITDNYKIRVALDNYEAEGLLGKLEIPELIFSEQENPEPHTILAVGGERGWSARERKMLSDYGFKLYSIGERVLKTETACAAGLSIIFSKMGLM